LNDVMMSNIFREYTAVYGYTLSTPAAGSTTLLNSYDGFTADMVGKKIELTGPYNASPWVKGIYSITSFVNPRTVILDRSPTPTAAADRAAGIVEGSSTGIGWKNVIFFGNSPKGASSSGMEVTMMNPRQIGIPAMYGQQGYDGYGYQDVRGCTWSKLDPLVTNNPALYTDPPCKRFKANDWVELTGRIEIRGAPNAPESRVQLWVDGELAIDYDKAKINWASGDGDGLGQFDLTPYHTRKDPTQVHATGILWYDDLIVSTQPIAMTNGTTTGTQPTVSVTAPSAGAIVSGTSVTVSASASSAGGIAGVQFKLDGFNLGSEKTTSPYSLAWDTTQASNGWHTLTAVARESNGNQTSSPAVVVLVSNNADLAQPTVSITAPGPNATVSGSVNITASASDNIGVAGVQFKLDGKNLGAEKTAPPYSIDWDTKLVTNGSHALTAVARDAAGNQTITSAVTVTVNNPVVADTVAPTVSITAPTGNSTVSGTSVALSASASDNIGVAGVQFKLDGANLGAERITPPYSIAWNTVQATNGSHTLTAIARDVAGNQTTSATLTVTVNNSSDTVAPIAVITAPGMDATVTGTSAFISALAWDNIGVTSVQFKLDGLNLGPEKTEPPYSMTWNTTQVPNGAHTLTAVVRDAARYETTSVAIRVTVNNASNQAGKTPTVRYSIPAQGAQQWITTDAAAPMAVGYGRLQPDLGGNSALAGVVIFSHYSGDVLVSQTSVPMSAPIQSGRVYAEISGPINAGVAFVNPNDEDATISFSFVDSAGRDISSGLFFLGAKQQFSGFLTEAPFNLRGNLEGTFTFTSTQYVSVIALRGLINERNEFLMTTLPVVSGNGNTTSTLVPHFAVGGGWTTKLVLMNPTNTTLAGKLEFMDSGAPAAAASPLTVVANGVMMSSGWNYVIPARGITRLTLSSVDGDLKAGSVRLTSADINSTPAGVAIFSFAAGGITVSEAGVPIDKAGSSFRVYAESSGIPGAIGSFQTGVALANTTAYPVVANFELKPLDATGTPLTGSVTIPAGGQIARFLKELIPNTPDTFKGVLAVRTTGSVGAIGLRLTTNARGDYLVTTIPVATETEQTTTEPQIFPHVVAGGGYTTEIIIMSRQSVQAGAGELTFSGKGGSPLSIMPR